VKIPIFLYLSLFILYYVFMILYQIYTFAECNANLFRLFLTYFSTFFCLNVIHKVDVRLILSLRLSLHQLSP